MSRFPNRRWLVIPSSLTSSINFDEVLESNIDGLRLSIDGSETFVKYEVNEVTESYDIVIEEDPETGEQITETIEKGVYGRPSIYSGSYTEYKHSEMLTLLGTDKWTSDEDLLY